MALTRSNTALVFADNSLAAGEQVESNEIVADVTTINAQLHLSATNAGAASAGDTIDFYIIQTGATVYDGSNSSHAILLGTVDTVVGNEQITRPISIPQAGIKVLAVRPAGGSANAITVVVSITEQKAA